MPCEPLKVSNLNFLTTSFGLPTCLKISIDLPYPTRDTFGNSELIILITFFGSSSVLRIT